jgi:ATP-dependent DNA ligase
MLYAFDPLELNGKDLRPLPHGDGAVVFRQACKLGFEGIVSKRLGAPDRSRPLRDWIKVKNPDSPAMVRFREGRREK